MIEAVLPSSALVCTVSLNWLFEFPDSRFLFKLHYRGSFDAHLEEGTPFGLCPVRQLSVCVPHAVATDKTNAAKRAPT